MLSRLDEALHEYRRRTSQGRFHRRGRASCRHRTLASLTKEGQLESWNPNPVFFKKGENPNFPPDSPMQPSRASAQILRQYAPLRLLSVGSIASAPRVASAAEMAALILNPARHGAREMRPLARAAGFRQYAQVLLAACSLLNRGTRMLLRVWRRRYLEARSLCMSCRTTTRTVTTIQSARVRVQSSESEELWQAAGSRQVVRAFPWQVLILYGRPTH